MKNYIVITLNLEIETSGNFKVIIIDRWQSKTFFTKVEIYIKLILSSTIIKCKIAL